MQPDNFLYFIALFTLAIGGGTHMLFSYQRNWILVGNALTFFLCAYRIASEFAIHLIDSYSIANTMATIHSIVSISTSALLWICTYAYVRPFQSSKYEKQLTWGIFFLFLPCISYIYYGMYHRYPFTLSTEKINDRWLYLANADSSYLWVSNVFIISAFLWLGFLFIVDIAKTRQKVLFKTILILCYIGLPIAYIYAFHMSPNANGYQLPNAGLTYISFTIITSWFCSDYRLFQNTFNNAVKDILDSIADLAVLTDHQLRIQYANQPLLEQLNQPKVTGSVSSLLATYSHLSLPEIEQKVQRLMTSEVQQEELQFDVNNYTYTFRLRMKPFYRAKKHIGYIFIMNDLTVLRQKEQLLSHSNRTKDQLFAIIGHDLRKPALAFRGISRKVNYLLKNNDLVKLRQLGNSWESSANFLNHLINNLLNWALQQRGTLPHHPEKVRVINALDATLESLTIIANDKGIKLVTNVPETIIILADFNGLVTILRNLIDNAIKYTPQDGQIKINAKTESDQVIIQIIDNGIGMSTEQIEQLFLIRKNKSRKGTNGEAGTGLGLNLVKELVKINYGTLELDSQPDHGTTVSIIFPVIA